MRSHLVLRDMRVASFLCVALSLGFAVWAAAPQKDATARSWNQPVPPFRILGNLYYVGANEITSYLIVTPAGDVLLDGGFEETAPQIEANIRTLGFHLSDVKILLNSHAHYDHAGGLAELRRATGAAFYASAGDAPVLESGNGGDADAFRFSPVRPNRLIGDGETIRLGETELTAHVTAGHTPGCTTWTTTLGENGSQYHVVFVCSTSVLSSYRLVGKTTYPGITEDYAKTFRTLRLLPCDVFLGPHGSFFDLTEKRAALAAGAKSSPFINPQQYRAYLDKSEAAFREELRRQQGQAKPGA